MVCCPAAPQNEQPDDHDQGQQHEAGTTRPFLDYVVSSAGDVTEQNEGRHPGHSPGDAEREERRDRMPAEPARAGSKARSTPTNRPKNTAGPRALRRYALARSHRSPPHPSTEGPLTECRSESAADPVPHGIPDDRPEAAHGEHRPQLRPTLVDDHAPQDHGRLPREEQPDEGRGLPGSEQEDQDVAPRGGQTEEPVQGCNSGGLSSPRVLARVAATCLLTGLNEIGPSCGTASPRWPPTLRTPRSSSSALDGHYLIDVDGRRYLDGFSSLWVSTFGHKVPELDAALIEQLDRVAHSTQLGNGNRIVIELSEALAEVVPVDRPHFLYASDGAAAVEQALKIAFQYWRNLGVQSREGLSRARVAPTTVTP